jgi:hypothetical protein
MCLYGLVSSSRMAEDVRGSSLEVLILPLWAPCRIGRECPARARYDVQLRWSRAVGRGHGILNYPARGGIAVAHSNGVWGSYRRIPRRLRHRRSASCPIRAHTSELKQAHLLGGTGTTLRNEYSTVPGAPESLSAYTEPTVETNAVDWFKLMFDNCQEVRQAGHRCAVFEKPSHSASHTLVR